MRRYDYEIPQATNKQYLHTMTAGATLPLVQAAITGSLVAVLVLVVAYTLRARSPLTWCAVAGIVTLGLTWLTLQRRWLQLTDLERITGIDLNHDGRIGTEPTREPREIKIRVAEIKDDQHYQETIYPLPLDIDQLKTLAEGLAAGEPFNERTWCGLGRPFSQGEFRRLRGEMVKRGLIAITNPKDPRCGYSLTLAGKHIFNEIKENDQWTN